MPKTPRKAISKATRFRIFARDNFTCSYCGRQPPTVTLEPDHVVPICQGGTNDDTNLTTSCWDCNHGKGKHTIGEVVPTDQQRLIQAQELAEKRRQLAEIAECVKAANELEQTVINHWCKLLSQKQCDRGNISCLINLISEFGVQEVFRWMQIATAKFYWSEIKAIKYVCGIARHRRAEERGVDNAV